MKTKIELGKSVKSKVKTLMNGSVYGSLLSSMYKVRCLVWDSVRGSVESSITNSTKWDIEL